MCGRFGVSTPENIEDRFNTMGDALDMSPSYNIAPSFHVPVITRNSPNKAELMKWGFIPHWTKDLKKARSVINARDDSVMVSPFYREAFYHDRCIVPFSFFYEWKRFTLDGKEQKQPYLFKVKGEELMGFAGIYSTLKDAEGREFKTFAIITTSPNKLLKPIHNRMPVILHKDDEDRWLTYESEVHEMHSLLKPYPATKMESWRVSTEVNSPRNDSPELIEPLEE